MQEIDERSALLLGEEVISSLANKRIIVFGIGGVGGSAAEALLRSGVKNLTLVDFDVVSFSNLNRQILFVEKDVGRKKAEVGRERLLSIRKDADIDTIDKKIDDAFISNMDLSSFDYVIDAIDDVPAKIALARKCLKDEVPLITSLGMGNRLDPRGLEVTTLDKTHNDPLARKIRYLFRQEGLDPRKIECVFSPSSPIVKGKTPASMMMVPSSAGLLIAFYVIKRLEKI